MSGIGLQIRRNAEKYLVCPEPLLKANLDWITRSHRGVCGTLRQRGVRATTAHFIGPEGGSIEKGFAIGLESWPDDLSGGAGAVECVSPDSKLELDQQLETFRRTKELRQVIYDSGLGDDDGDPPPLDDGYRLQAALAVPQTLFPLQESACNGVAQDGVFSFAERGGQWHGATFPEIIPAIEDAAQEIVGSVRALLHAVRSSESKNDRCKTTTEGKDSESEESAVGRYLEWCEAVIPDVGLVVIHGLTGVFPLHAQARQALDLVTTGNGESATIFEKVGQSPSTFDAVSREIVKLEEFLDAFVYLCSEPLIFLAPDPPQTASELTLRFWRRARERLLRESDSMPPPEACDLTLRHSKRLLFCVSIPKFKSRIRRITARLILLLVDADVITRSLPKEVRCGLMARQKAWQDYVRKLLARLRHDKNWRLTGDIYDCESDAVEDYIRGQTRIVRAALEMARARAIDGEPPLVSQAYSETGMRSALVASAIVFARRNHSLEAQQTSGRDLDQVSENDRAESYRDNGGVINSQRKRQQPRPSAFLIGLQEEGRFLPLLRLLFGGEVEAILSKLDGKFDTEFLLRQAYRLGGERVDVVAFVEGSTESLSERTAMIKFYDAVRGYDEARISSDTSSKDAATWTKRIQRAAQDLPEHSRDYSAI